ncbi:MAG: SpoIID/LytB domain-containing protein [Vulcanimicrobiaceae bacterium]
MRRSGFVSGTSAAIAALCCHPAGATGGLDTFSPSPNSPPPQVMRVLLGSGLAAPIDGQRFSFGSRTFRGTFSELPDGQIVNSIALESYLYGVVPMESPRHWPAEALKAQAVVARTYALAHVNPQHPYDVAASQRDQAYGGIEAEDPLTTSACDATAGQILRWNGRIATVSYMSCCGGHTEDPADAWTGGADLPYLRGVACSYCSASPDYRWTRDVPIGTLRTAFAAALNPLGQLRTAVVSSADASGRAKSIRFTGEDGSIEIPGSDFRRLLGGAVVRSLLIRSLRLRADDEAQAATTLTIEGSGRGHGVGLCQWGAFGLASQGREARDILAFYFPGIQYTNG